MQVMSLSASYPVGLQAAGLSASDVDDESTVSFVPLTTPMFWFLSEPHEPLVGYEWLPLSGLFLFVCM